MILRTDVAAANARGYNRWMSDFCRRTLTVCMEWELHLQSVDHAVAEIEFYLKQDLLGMTFRPERYNGLDFPKK